MYRPLAPVNTHSGLVASPSRLIGKKSGHSVEPDNVTVHRFAPGWEMLTRASVHITHGGNNSVHESLIAGVPMLCMPQAYDQFPLTGRVEQLGAGRVIEESPLAIREGVRWLLEDPGPRSRARELGEHLLSYDGEGRVAEVLERVLADNLPLAA